MSEVKDTYYQLLTPRMEQHGFQFKKSKSCYTKVQNDLEYIIHFKWDGRGGLTLIDHIWLTIDSLPIEKAVKKTMNWGNLGHFSSGVIGCTLAPHIIPVMYSRAALDIANEMNLRKLGQLPYDQKYPSDRILNCVNKSEAYILKELMPSVHAITSEADIYQWLCAALDKLSDLEAMGTRQIMTMKQYAEKLNMPLPAALIK
jgi:hypothetical protein